MFCCYSDTLSNLLVIDIKKYENLILMKTVYVTKVIKKFKSIYQELKKIIFISFTTQMKILT